MEIAESSPYAELKDVDSLCADSPDIPDPLLKLAEWMALYYCCPRELAIRNLLPGAVRNGKIKARMRAVCRIGDQNKAADKFFAKHRNLFDPGGKLTLRIIPEKGGRQQQKPHHKSGLKLYRELGGNTLLRMCLEHLHNTL